jgi:hypothetical protein
MLFENVANLADFLKMMYVHESFFCKKVVICPKILKKQNKYTIQQYNYVKLRFFCNYFVIEYKVIPLLNMMLVFENITM